MSNPLEEARTAVVALSEAVSRWIEDAENVEALFLLLDDVRQVRDSVAAIEDRVQVQCAHKMTHHLYLGEGFTAQKSRSRRDVWDHRKLAFALVDRWCVNQVTGEVLIDLQAATGLMDRLLEVAHVDYWRVGELASLGVDPQEYRQREWGRWSVRVRRGRDVEDVQTTGDFL